MVNPNRFLFLLDSNPWITVTLAMIGKFQIAASFAVIYVYAGELMPTVVRSEAMGISSFVAGIGLLLFPYINALVRHDFQQSACEARFILMNCLFFTRTFNLS